MDRNGFHFTFFLFLFYIFSSFSLFANCETVFVSCILCVVFIFLANQFQFQDFKYMWMWTKDWYGMRQRENLIYRRNRARFGVLNMFHVSFTIHIIVYG